MNAISLSRLEPLVRWRDNPILTAQRRRRLRPRQAVPILVIAAILGVCGLLMAGLSGEPFQIIAPSLPNGKAAGLHLSLSDKSGDSAIFEYVNGELVVHHGSEYQVMTNSPTYDEQLALTAYWSQIGGLSMLPGTNRAADRFVRTSFYLQSVPKFPEPRLATSAAFSIIRNASVPLGITDANAPNIASTIWRSVADHGAGRYYFESAVSPNVFWVDLENLDLAEGGQPQKLSLKEHPILAGDVSDKFSPAEPFKWLAH